MRFKVLFLLADCGVVGGGFGENNSLIKSKRDRNSFQNKYQAKYFFYRKVDLINFANKQNKNKYIVLKGRLTSE